ncbi:MAG: cysteine desulfurase NifS [bacterium]
MEKKLVYLDNAATTSVKHEVVDIMLPFFTEKYGNPSTIYSLGTEAKEAIEDARMKVAKALGAEKNEIYFTGSGTEADNWALKGIAHANSDKGKHIITSKIEHHAILHTCKALENEGFEVSYISVDENGIINLDELEKSIRKDTILISVMYANNEIGTIQPVKEITKIAHKHNVYFHTDAVQAVGNVPIDVKDLDIDLFSLSGHKIHGPKGIGVLYIKDGVQISSFIHGGGQERGKRASTENIPSIVGLGKAIELATQDIGERTENMKNLRDELISRILEDIPFSRLNGDKKKRLPGNVNISFEYIEGESILLILDQEGICASSGSACTSASLAPSHVLLAIGLSPEIAHGSIRFSIGDENTKEDIDYVMEKLPGIISKLREMSPLFEKKNKDAKIQ